jgi:hypothetical protein
MACWISSESTQTSEKCGGGANVHEHYHDRQPLPPYRLTEPSSSAIALKLLTPLMGARLDRKLI